MRVRLEGRDGFGVLQRDESFDEELVDQRKVTRVQLRSSVRAGREVVPDVDVAQLTQEILQYERLAHLKDFVGDPRSGLLWMKG